MKILVVEDEEHIAQGLVFNFELEQYQATVAPTGEEALRLFGEGDYDLILLDVMLPGIDGFEVARAIRQVDARVPILMLTAMAADEDRIAGLECGVDDYLTKPFVLKELMLRVAGLLRRAAWQAPATPDQRSFSFGQAEINPENLSAQIGARTHQLTRIEFDLLRYFMMRPGRLVSRKELLTAVWGYEPNTATRTVDTFVLRLRKIIEPHPSKPVFLISIRGAGYQFNPEI